LARLKVTALLLTPLLLVAGCSAFFGFNAFSSFDKPPAPKLSDYTGAGGLSKLAGDLTSKAVVAALAADPTTTQQLEAYLLGVYTGGGPDAQQAAALYADVNLKTTLGEDLVNNVVAALMTNPPSGNIASILQSLLPPGATADQATFSAMVDGLLNAEAAYMVLGVSTPLPPPGVNMGDVAQKAAVSLMMKTVVHAVALDRGVLDTDPLVMVQMFLLATNQTNLISGVSVPDPFPANPPWLVNIFAAAGATYPS
jgi:hypothetical protein